MTDKPKFTNDGIDTITRDGGPTLTMKADEGGPPTKRRLDKLCAILNAAAKAGKI